MRRVLVILCVGMVGLGFLTMGCVTTGTHEAVLKQLDDTQKELAGTKTARDGLDQEKKKCDENLKTELQFKNQAQAELVAKGMQIDKLLNEKGALAKERTQLSDEQKALAKQIEELQRMKAAADKRTAEYRSLIEKLRKMIDAGTLQVKIRNGRMLVQMSSDVVFPSASVNIKPEAKAAIEELALTIRTFQDRKFQVIGHSDPTPIRTARFPSNWELSTQRAIEVVKLMVEAGVPPEMISSAGAAEFDPLNENESPEGRTQNRRVEIVFEPKIDELPGFDQVMSTGK